MKNSKNNSKNNLKNNSKIGVIVVGSVLFVLLIALSTVYAFPRVFSGRMSGKTPFGMNQGNFTYNDSAIIDAIKNNDYNAYLNALDVKWQAFRSTITPDVFNKMVQNYDNRTTQMQERQAANAQIVQAIKDDSYTEWQQAISALPNAPAFASKINSTNFDIYVQLYNAQQSKNFTEVKTLSSELGINGVPGIWSGASSGALGNHGRMMSPHQFGNKNIPASN
jgi:hypothetical protein